MYVYISMHVSIHVYKYVCVCVCVQVCVAGIRYSHLFVQLPPNPVELEAIKRLITEEESDFACSLIDASQPLLQQLAFHYCESIN